MLLKVQQDSSSFEDEKIVARSIDENRNTAIRIELDKPWFFLNVRGQVDDFGASGLKMGIRSLIPRWEGKRTRNRPHFHIQA